MANVPLQALGGRGAKEWRNLWSGTWEYLWHSLHGITRLGLIVSASASGELLFLLLLREPGTGELCVPFFTRCILLQQLREPGTGEFCVPFFTRGISLLTSAP